MQIEISKRTILFLLISIVCVAIIASCNNEQLHQNQSYQIVSQVSLDSLDMAKAFALAFSGIAIENNELYFSQQRYDPEAQIYEFTYSFQNCDYYCKIGIEDNIVLEYEFDGTLSRGRTSGRVLGQSEIRSLLLLMDETINESTITMQMDKSDDDGQAVYEGTASGKGFDYEFEFQVNSGIIVQWKSNKKDA